MRSVELQEREAERAAYSAAHAGDMASIRRLQELKSKDLPRQKRQLRLGELGLLIQHVELRLSQAQARARGAAEESKRLLESMEEARKQFTELEMKCRRAQAQNFTLQNMPSLITDEVRQLHTELQRLCDEELESNGQS
ncbi:MAG: hypothetical protein M3362_07310 [Acidobacteriota bacterium]|nr:hypothetical protein [Acidobacteriota bacterium]